ncbi:Protein PAL1 [Cladobotryum mycophilum]|uniref:Protein PAL1 n=1 Tax=Cladobotryum mycophilum TaxID=491253 RepID=A0ABR0SG80_9HYPO
MNNNNQLIDLSTSSPPAQQRPAPQRGGENQPPIRPANSRHRPTLSQEEALRARKPQFATSKASPAVDSPQRKPQRRPRRNSDSSLMDFDNKPLSEEEKKMIEAKRREREQRRRDGKEKPKSGRPSRKMDIIDQLDATSIYGTGLFHHDGPFDALNPHRNRQNGRRLAPMQAFPKDSLNNTIGGAGPLNPQADHSTFMGHGTDEAFRDFATTSKKNNYGYSSSRETAIFDAASRGNMVHGDESYGLGTSTFLEGTPAARSTIIRRQAEQQQEIADGGLQRKKSLAQRIRHINKGPRDYAPSGRSPDQSHFGTSLGSEGGTYFSEYSKGDESIDIKKGRDGKLSPPPIPRRSSGSALERRSTADAAFALPEEIPAKPSGLLGRMKSLKGGRRSSRNETP